MENDNQAGNIDDIFSGSFISDALPGRVISGRDVIYNHIIEQTQVSPQVSMRISQLIEQAYHRNQDSPLFSLIYDQKDQDPIISELKAIGQPSLDGLAFALTYEGEMGEVAAYILGSMGEMTLPVLETAAQSESTKVRQRAAFALGQIGDISLELLVKMLNDEDEEVQATVVIALGNLGEIAYQPIRETLEKGTLEVRANAAVSLGQLGEIALEGLQIALNDPHQKVRVRAVESLSQIGGPALEIMHQALNDKDPAVRKAVVKAFGMVGKPELQNLRQALSDSDAGVRKATLLPLSQIGEPAIKDIITALSDTESNVRKTALVALTKYDAVTISAHSASLLEPLTAILNDEDQQTRRYAVVILGQIGEPALDSLEVAISDKDITVKESVLDALGQIGTPALYLFAKIVADSDEQATKFAIETLASNIGVPALPIIKQVLESGSLSDRYYALRAAMRMGKPGLNLVVGSLEDPDGQISEHTIHYFSGPKSGEWNEQFEQMPNIEPDDISQVILNELIIRKSERPEQFFSPRTAAKSLQVTIERSPRLYNELQTQLCNLVFEGNSALRQRAISVARILGPGDFAAKVKNRGIEQPDVAREVMRTLGGGEAAAYFAEQQNQALDRFRAPLIELEETARQRWEDLTLEARKSSSTSKWMSVGVFLVGTAVVIWAFVLVSLSNEPGQQILAALAGIASFLAMYLRRFWKEPVEQIQKFSAQQARLQVAFIGYMNRVAQLRLFFEDVYMKGDLTIEDFNRYQEWLREATDEAWKQLAEPISSNNSDDSY